MPYRVGKKLPLDVEIGDWSIERDRNWTVSRARGSSKLRNWNQKQSHSLSMVSRGLSVTEALFFISDTKLN